MSVEMECVGCRREKEFPELTSIAVCEACKAWEVEHRAAMDLEHTPRVSFYTSPEWKITHKNALDRDGHKCQRCGVTAELVVHHKIPRKSGGTDKLDNLKTVCRSCHMKEHRELGVARR